MRVSAIYPPDKTDDGKTPLSRVLDALGEGVKRSGGGYVAKCPAHDDRHPSLSVSEGDDGRALLKCFAGCSTEAVAEALGLTLAQLMPPLVPTTAAPTRTSAPATTATTSNGNGEHPAPDWQRLHEHFVAALTLDRLEELANMLAVTPEALQRCGCGWCEEKQVWTFPERDARRAIVGIATRDRDGNKSFLPGGHRGVVVPDGVELSDTVCAIEGPSDLAAMLTMDVSAVARPSNCGGADALAALLVDAADVLVIGENDAKPDGTAPGIEGARDTAAKLAEAWRRPVKWALPPDGYKDVRTYLNERDSVEADELGRGLVEHFQATAETVEPPAEAAPAGAADAAAAAAADDTAAGSGEDEDVGDKVVIKVTAHEDQVIEQTIAALRNDADLFQRGGQLVRIVRGDNSDGITRPADTPAIRLAPPPHLRERISRRVLYAKYNAKIKGYVPAHVPDFAVSAIVARGEWSGIRELVRVSDVPVLRPDGSVWQQHGHDAVTGVLYEPVATASVPPIPDTLTREDATAAAAELLDVTRDFPFSTSAHRAACLAAMLTPLARPAFEGPAPGFVFDANIRGVGKTLLAQAAGMIGIGGELPVSSYASDPEEMRKRITSIALAGDPLVLLDNVDGVLGNDAFDRVLTSTRWRDRVLGKSEEVDLPMLTVWFATGNNLQVAADTSRRLLQVLLDCLDERPEHRSGFKYPDILGHVRQHRPQLVRAGLVVLAAFLRAGAPDQGLRPFGSFEGWSRLVRQAVVWCGHDDPCHTQELLADGADTTRDTLRQLLDAWEGYVSAGVGYTVADLISRLYPEQREYMDTTEAATAMRNAFEALTDTPHGRTPSTTATGARLRRFRRRVVDGQYLDRNRTKHGNEWRLHQTQAAPGG